MAGDEIPVPIPVPAAPGAAQPTTAPGSFLPVSLPPGVSVVPTLHFSDPELQAVFDHGLDSVPPGHSEIEFEFHADQESAKGHVIGLQRLGGGWELRELLGVEFQSGSKPKAEAGLFVRWSG